MSGLPSVRESQPPKPTRLCRHGSSIERVVSATGELLDTEQDHWPHWEWRRLGGCMRPAMVGSARCSRCSAAERVVAHELQPKVEHELDSEWHEVDEPFLHEEQPTWLSMPVLRRWEHASSAERRNPGLYVVGRNRSKV